MPTTPPPGAAPPLCAAAVDLIIACEVTDQRTYERLYSHPTWPREASGVTIGIGWDCAHNDRAALDREWSALPDADRDALAAVLGLSGSKARAALPAVKHVVVPWGTAVQSFEAHTLPRYVALTLDAFPGAGQLPPECFGALVSLVFNRGTSMGTRGKPSWESRREMRAVRDLIATGDLAAVPAQIRAMKRLWPVGMDGLPKRRDDEAALWESGLPLVIDWSAPLGRGAKGRAVEVLQQALAARGFSAGRVDGDFGPATERAVRAFQMDAGLPVTGTSNPATAYALGLTAPRGAVRPVIVTD